MLHIGIDVHQKSSVFNVFDPHKGREGGTHRSQKVETTAEGFRKVLEPLAGRCEVVYEVGPMAQWVAAQVRPYAANGCRASGGANAEGVVWMTGNVLVTMDGIERCVARRFLNEIAARCRGAVVPRREPWDRGRRLRTHRTSPRSAAGPGETSQEFSSEPDLREWAVHEFSNVPDAWQ